MIGANVVDLVVNAVSAVSTLDKDQSQRSHGALKGPGSAVGVPGLIIQSSGVKAILYGMITDLFIIQVVTDRVRIAEHIHVAVGRKICRNVWLLELAKKLGVKLVIEDMEFDSVLLAPNANKAHISMAGISYSEKRDETLDFTVGVFDSSQVIIVKADSAINGPFDLGGKKVGVQSGTVGQLLAEMDPDWAGEGDDVCLAEPASVSKFSTGAEAVIALTQDKEDAVIIDKYPAENFVKNNAGIKIAEETVFDDEYAFAVKEGSKELVKWLNEAIAEMKADGTMDAINAKYFG